MINVEKDQATDIVVTFTERTTVSPVYYLIEVLNFKDEVVETFTPTEQSSSLERYNKFTITSSLPKGEYTYQAWQSTTENPTKNDVTGNPVEYGLFVVSSDEDLEDSVYL